MDETESILNELTALADELDRTNGWTPERRSEMTAMLDKATRKRKPKQSPTLKPPGKQYIASAEDILRRGDVNAIVAAGFPEPSVGGYGPAGVSWPNPAETPGSGELALALQNRESARLVEEGSSIKGTDSAWFAPGQYGKRALALGDAVVEVPLSGLAEVGRGIGEGTGLLPTGSVKRSGEELTRRVRGIGDVWSGGELPDFMGGMSNVILPPSEQRDPIEFLPRPGGGFDRVVAGGEDPGRQLADITSIGLGVGASFTPADAVSEVALRGIGLGARGVREIPKVATRIRTSLALDAIQSAMNKGGAAQVGAAFDAMESTRLTPDFMEEAARLQEIDRGIDPLLERMRQNPPPMERVPEGVVDPLAVGRQDELRQALEVRRAAGQSRLGVQSQIGSDLPGVVDEAEALILKYNPERQIEVGMAGEVLRPEQVALRRAALERSGLAPTVNSGPDEAYGVRAIDRRFARDLEKMDAMDADRALAEASAERARAAREQALYGQSEVVPELLQAREAAAARATEAARESEAAGVADTNLTRMVDDIRNTTGVMVTPQGPVRLSTPAPMGGRVEEVIGSLEALPPLQQEAVLREAAGVYARGEGLTTEAALMDLRRNPEKVEQYVLPIVESRMPVPELPRVSEPVPPKGAPLGPPRPTQPPAPAPAAPPGGVKGTGKRGANRPGSTTAGSLLGALESVPGAGRVAIGATAGAAGGALSAPDAESRPSRVLAGALLGGAVAGIGSNPKVTRAVADLWAKGGEMARPLTGSAAEATAALRAKAEKATIAMAGPAEWVGERATKAYTAMFDAMGRAKKHLTGDDRLFGQSFAYLFTSGDAKPRYGKAAQRVTEIIRGTPEIFDFDLAPALDVVDRARKAHPEISEDAWDAGYAFIHGTMKVDDAAFSRLPEDVRQAFRDYARQRAEGTRILVENGNLPAEAADKYARGWTSQSDLAKVNQEDELLRKAFGAEVPGANVKPREINPSTPEQARAIGIETDPHYAMTLGNFKQSRAVMMSKSIEALRTQAVEVVEQARKVGIQTEEGRALLRTSPLLPPEAFGKTDDLVAMTAARKRAEEAGYVYMAPSEGAFKPYGKAEGWWMARELRDHMRGQLEFSDNAVIANLRRLTGISNLANVARVSAFLRDGTTNTLKAIAAGVSPFNPANAAHYSDALRVLARSLDVIEGLAKTGDQAFRSLVDTQGAGAFWVKELTEELDAPIRAAMKRGMSQHDAVVESVMAKITSSTSKGRRLANEVIKYKVWLDNYFKVAHALKLAREAPPSALRKLAERTAVGAGIGAISDDENRLRGAAVGGAIGAASMGVLPGRRRGNMTLEAAAREARRYYPAPGFEAGILEAARKQPGSGLGLTYWGGTFRGIKNIALDRPEGFAYVAATLGATSAFGDAWGKVTPEERAAANKAHGRFSIYLYRDAAGKPRFFDPLGMDVWAPFASALGARGPLEETRSGVLEAAAEAATSIAFAPIVQGTVDAGRALVEDEPNQLFRHTPLVRPDESKVGAAARIAGTGLTGVVAHTADVAWRTAVGTLSPKKAIFSYIGLSPQAPAEERARALFKYPAGLVKDFGKQKARVLREVKQGERTRDNATRTIQSMQETLADNMDRFVRIARESGVPDEAIGEALDEVEIPEEVNR